jgi:hypothetical protein
MLVGDAIRHGVSPYENRRAPKLDDVARTLREVRKGSGLGPRRKRNATNLGR